MPVKLSSMEQTTHHSLSTPPRRSGNSMMDFTCLSGLLRSLVDPAPREPGRLSPQYTQEQLAQILGYRDRSSVNRILSGQRKLSAEGVTRLKRHLKLKGLEKKYFNLLAEKYLQGESVRLTRLLSQLKKEADFLKVEGTQETFDKKWLYGLVREMSFLKMPEKSPQSLRKKIRFPVTTPEVKSVLDAIQERESLKDTPLGKQPKIQFTQNGAPLSENKNRRETHRQILKLASKALDEVPLPQRKTKGLTLAIHESDIDIVRKKIENFVHEINLEHSRKKADAVYHLNVNFFPLTETSTPQVHSNEKSNQNTLNRKENQNETE